MPRAFLYILFLVFSVASVFSTDVIVTDARKIIIGQVENETLYNIQIKDHRKKYTIPKNRIEFKFNLPEISTEEKIKLLPTGLPFSIDRIDKCQGLFYGISNNDILLISNGEVSSVSITEIISKYEKDFPDIRLFNLIELLENKRDQIDLCTYELGTFEAGIIKFDTKTVKILKEQDTLDISLNSIISINGKSLFGYKEHKNSFSKRYLFLPSSYIGKAEEVSMETISLYYNAFSYNISSWLQIAGGFSTLTLIEQFSDHPLSFSAKAALPVADQLNMFAELIVFHANGKMPGLSHVGINYGSTENNIAIIYSYQSGLENDFDPNIISLAGVVRLYKSIYFTTEFSIMGESEDNAYIGSNAIQINLDHLSFKVGAIYFIAEKKEYSILPLLKAEFDF